MGRKIMKTDGLRDRQGGGSFRINEDVRKDHTTTATYPRTTVE
jgi:hypothetical protein